MARAGATARSESKLSAAAAEAVTEGLESKKSLILKFHLTIIHSMPMDAANAKPNSTLSQTAHLPTPTVWNL